MVKEIEKVGLPVVQMCNLIPVAKTVGVNRIVPTISIRRSEYSKGSTMEIALS